MSLKSNLMYQSSSKLLLSIEGKSLDTSFTANYRNNKSIAKKCFLPHRYFTFFCTRLIIIDYPSSTTFENDGG